MKNNPDKTIVITDSGFGGLSVLAQIYENLKNDKIYFPLNLFFIEALPKNCKGYPWQGYSLMPDKETKVKVFDNFLSGAERNFNPTLLAVACNTLSAIIRDTGFYRNNSDKILNIIDIGLERFKQIQIEKDAYLIILATETTISGDIHRQWLIKNRIFKNEKIIPLFPNPKANYPLLIETEPYSQKTYKITEDMLLKGLEKVGSSQRLEPTPVIYLYLGCTHFGFIQNTYYDILNKAGFKKIIFINPNDDMAEKVTDFIKKLNHENDMKNSTYPINIKIYSQFTLTSEQISSGSRLIGNISPAIADALKNYTVKDDITDPWRE